MASTSSFSPRNVEFNEFLFAAIGDDKNGMVLTVASALARLGFDPWNEAGRLARLPRIGATDALARIISKLPVGNWQISELPHIAARLTQLLPALVPPAIADAATARGARPDSSKLMIWIVCLSLFAGAVYAMTPGATPRLDIPPAPGAAAPPSPPLH